MNAVASPLAPEVRALVLAVLAKRVAGTVEPIKAEFSPRYEPGTTIKWESPLDGGLLGLVQRTRPEARWEVTDRDKLHEHLREFPGCVEDVLLLPVPGVGLVELDEADELARVVAEHAPHMLVREQRVTQASVDAAVEQSRATGQAAAPGITLIRPGGQLRVVPDKNAGDVVERMVAAGIVTWDGRPVLPAGDEPEQVAS